jgi:hypothetical protein
LDAACGKVQELDMALALQAGASRLLNGANCPQPLEGQSLRRTASSYCLHAYNFGQVHMKANSGKAPSPNRLDGHSCQISLPLSDQMPLPSSLKFRSGHFPFAVCLLQEAITALTDKYTHAASQSLERLPLFAGLPTPDMFLQGGEELELDIG